MADHEEYELHDQLKRGMGSESGGDDSDMGSLFGDEEEAEVTTEQVVVEESTEEVRETVETEDDNIEESETPAKAPVFSFHYEMEAPPPDHTAAPTVPQMGSQIPDSVPIFYTHGTSDTNESQSSTLPDQKKWSLDDEKIALVAERDDARRQYEAIEKHRDRALDDIENLEKALAETEKRAEEAEADKAELLDHVETLQAEVNELKQELSNTKTAINNHQSESQQLSRLENDLANYKSLNEVKDENLVFSASEIRELKETNESLQRVIDSLETELETENEAKIREIREMEALKEQLVNSRADLGEAQRELGGERETRRKLEEHIEGLQGMITESDQTIRALKASVPSPSYETSPAAAAAQQQISSLQKSIESLRNDLAAEKIAAENMVRDTAERLTDKDRSLVEAIQQKHDSKAEAEGRLREMEGLRRERDEALAMVGNLEKEKSAPAAGASGGVLGKLKDVWTMGGNEKKTQTEEISLSSSSTEWKKLYEEAEAKLGGVEKELQRAKEQLESTSSSSTKTPKIPKIKITPTPKPKKIKPPKPVKHYWDPNPSSRDPDEPSPTAEMRAEEEAYLSDPQNNSWPKWFVWKNSVAGGKDGLAGEGEWKPVFNDKGWEKEKERVKRDWKGRARVEGSRVSGRANKGVGPERFVDESGDEGEGRKRRRVA